MWEFFFDPQNYTGFMILKKGQKEKKEKET